MLADARPQARKNRRRIRWNTLRMFSSRERRRCPQIVCRSRMALLGQTPKMVPERAGSPQLCNEWLDFRLVGGTFLLAAAPDNQQDDGDQPQHHGGTPVLRAAIFDEIAQATDE